MNDIEDEIMANVVNHSILWAAFPDDYDHEAQKKVDEVIEKLKSLGKLRFQY